MRHHRTHDHFGTEDDTTVVLSSAIGKYAAGTTVAAVLADMFARVSSLEGGTHRVFSFTASAFIQPTFRANAVLKKTQSASFTVDAVLTAGGSFRADAVLRKTTSASFTVNAFIV